jgi:hypothetical protein
VVLVVIHPILLTLLPEDLLRQVKGLVVVAAVEALTQLDPQAGPAVLVGPFHLTTPTVHQD